MPDDLRPPYRIQFDNARDPYSARNALGITAIAGSGGIAPANAQYITAAADPTLTAERVLTNTATVTWDFATAGQAKANATGFGNVSNSGTPAAGQVAEWVTSTTIKGVSTYAKLTEVTNAYGVRGFSGSAIGTTSVTLNYHEVVVHDASGVGMLIKNVTGAVVNSASTGAGGCDVALSNGDVSFYAIWGSVPGASVICSNTGPPTGPALPATYTHWGYLTTLIRSAGVFITVAIRGNKVFHSIGQAVATNVNASTWTSYSTASAVPANASNVILNCISVMTTNATAGGAGLTYYISWTNSQQYTTRADCAPSSNAATAIHCILPNVSQAVYHQWQAIYGVGNISANGFYIQVIGYEVPNGS